MKIPCKVIISSLVLACFLSTNSLADTGIPQAESDAARISMLEKALAPQTPEATATLFAEANKTRNGAVQFMLFSDELKKLHKDSWGYWVSGISSPWITSYTVKKVKEDKKSWEFEVKYEWATASGPFKIGTEKMDYITVEAVPKGVDSTQKYMVTKY